MTIGLKKPFRGSHYLVATFSIVGCDSETGELGVAVLMRNLRGLKLGFFPYS